MSGSMSMGQTYSRALSSTQAIRPGQGRQEERQKDEEKDREKAVNQEEVNKHYEKILEILDGGDEEQEGVLEERLVASIDFSKTQYNKLGFRWEVVENNFGQCLRIVVDENQEESVLNEYNNSSASSSLSKYTKGTQAKFQTLKGHRQCTVAEAILDGDFIIEIRRIVNEVEEAYGGAPEMDSKLKQFENDATDDKATLQLVLARKSRFDFVYKQRHCMGSAIHIAAMHSRGHEIIAKLIERQCSVHDEFSFNSRGSEGRALPIHLAAGVGNDNFGQIVDALMKEDAGTIQAKSALLGVKNKNGTLQRHDNYTALHEACMYQNLDAVKILLEKKADVHAVNYQGSTALHIVAKRGAWQVAKALVAGKSNLTVRDKKFQSTPLMDAVDHGHFQSDKLHLLSDKTFEDIRTVARLCPAAASTMLRDKSNKVHDSWKEALKLDVVQWIELMRLAPEAGEDVLEALTEDNPEVTDEFNHPLPRRARLHPDQDYTCQYVPYKEWDYIDKGVDTEIRRWQVKLAPGLGTGAGMTTSRTSASLFSDPLSVLSRMVREVPCKVFPDSAGDNSPGREVEATPETSSKGELVPVKIRRLSVPGFLCAGVFEVLRDTHDHHIFVKLQSQGLLEYAWKYLVRWHFYLNVVFRVFDIIVLGIWVYAPPTDEANRNSRRLAWSYLAVSIHRDTIYEFAEMYSSLHGLGLNWFGELDETVIQQPWAYFYNWRNGLDLATLFVMIVLVYMTAGDQRLDAYPELMATLAFSRWSVLAYSFRAWPFAGRRILPIIRSFVPMAGIFLVTAFFFMGFLHAFLALDLAATVNEDVKVDSYHDKQFSILVNSVRFLLLGDGDGVSMVLGLGGEENPDGNLVTFCFFVVATMTFCICILNLFIAVHGEAYDAAQEKAFTGFLQERASICLQAFQRPYWPPRFLRSKKKKRKPAVGRMPDEHTTIKRGHSKGDRNEEAPDPETTAAQFPKKIPNRQLVIFLMAVVVVPIWAALVVHTEAHPAWPALFFLVFVILADMILLQRPWEDGEDGNDWNYLWFSFRVDYDESRDWPSAAKQPRGGKIDGRLTALKTDNSVRFRQMKGEISGLDRRIHEHVGGLNDRVDKVKDRMESLDDKLDAVLNLVQSALCSQPDESPPHEVQGKQSGDTPNPLCSLDERQSILTFEPSALQAPSPFCLDRPSESKKTALFVGNSSQQAAQIATMVTFPPPPPPRIPSPEHLRPATTAASTKEDGAETFQAQDSTAKGGSTADASTVIKAQPAPPKAAPPPASALSLPPLPPLPKQEGGKPPLLE